MQSEMNATIADAAYRLLNVHPRGAAMIAVASAPNFQSFELNETLRGDFARLAEERCELVVLDLRAVELFAAAFICQVVKLSQLLKVRSIRLRVCASPAVRDVMCITRMDRVFEVVETCEDEERAVP